MQFSVTFEAIERVIHRTSRSLRWISASVLFAMMFFVAADVIGRYFLNRPIKGDLELQEIMMVLIVFLALPYCQTEKGNVHVELVVDALKGRSKAILQSFAYLIGLSIIILLVWQMGLRGLQGLSSSRTDFTAMLLIPVWPFALIAATGMALMAVEWLVDLICSVRRVVGKGE